MTLKEFLDAMDNRGSGASEKSIALFEKELGAKLPADYRRFLSKCNGGNCHGHVIFKMKNRRVAGPCIENILGFRSENYMSLSWYLTLLRSGGGPPIPKDFLPIMDDPGGSAICLVWRGENRGEIHRWVPEGTRRLAGSFTNFIKGLRTAEEDDD